MATSRTEQLCHEGMYPHSITAW